MSILHNKIDTHFKSLDDREEPQRQRTELEELHHELEWVRRDRNTWQKLAEDLQTKLDAITKIIEDGNN